MPPWKTSSGTFHPLSTTPSENLLMSLPVSFTPKRITVLTSKTQMSISWSLHRCSCTVVLLLHLGVFSFNLASLGFIQTASQNWSLCSFHFWAFSVVWREQNTPIVVIDGCLGCLHFGALMKTATMNILTHFFFLFGWTYICISFGNIPKSRIVGSTVHMLSFSQYCQTFPEPDVLKNFLK